jgi:hypothetical protein
MHLERLGTWRAAVEAAVADRMGMWMQALPTARLLHEGATQAELMAK